MTEPLFDKIFIEKRKPYKTSFDIAPPKKSPIPEEVRLSMELIPRNEKIRILPYVTAAFSDEKAFVEKCDALLGDWRRFDANVNELSTKLSKMAVKKDMLDYALLSKWKSRLRLIFRVIPVKAFSDESMSELRNKIVSTDKTIASIRKQVQTMEVLSERLSDDIDCHLKAIQAISLAVTPSWEISARGRYLESCSISLQHTIIHAKSVGDELTTIEKIRQDLMALL